MAVNKRIILLLCVSMLLSVFLAACSGNNTPSNSGAAPDNKEQTKTNEPAEKTEPDEPEPVVEEKHDPVTLNVMNWGGDIEFFKPLYDEFTKKYPWITVKTFGSGGGDVEGLSKLAALQSSGEPPDIVWPQNISKWMDGGNLEDLSPYIENDPIVPTLGIKDGFLQAWSMDGKIYALPWTDDPWPIVINKDLMEKHGMEMPPNDWTYDDFRDMAKKATDPAAGEYGMSFNGVFKVQFPFLLPIANGHASGLNYMNDNNTQSMLNTPEVLADLKWLQDMYNVDKVMMDVETFNKSGYADGADFHAGKALFSIAQPLKQLDDMVDFEWDILPAPRGKVSQPGIRNTSPLAMLSASKNKDAAWLFIRFQFEYEANKWRIENIGFPSMVKNDELDALLATKYEGQNFEALKLSTTACCTADGPMIFDYGAMHDGIAAPATVAMFQDNKDISAVVPAIEDYNKRAAEYWKSIGVMK